VSRQQLAAVAIATTLILGAVAFDIRGSTPVEPTVAAQAPLTGAKVAYSKNRISSDQPIVFDTVEFDTSGFFDASQPDRLTVPVAGCYFVEAQVTILGWGYARSGLPTDSDPSYGNPPSPNFAIEIKRNGDPHDYVAAENRTNEDTGTAQIGHAMSVECFEAGDYIQLFVTGNRLVESNWPGTDGSLSPVLLMVLVGAAP
jgi:hypothetical protein